MQEHIRKLAKALKDHQAAYDAFCKANQAMRATLDESVAGLKAAGFGSPVITGHLGQIAKATTMQDSVSQVFGKGHELFHDSLNKALNGLATATETKMVRTNPNVRAAGGDIGVTEDATGQTPLPPLAGKVMTGKQMQEEMNRLAKTMPTFGSGRRVGRVNPNSVNPHWSKP